LSAAKDLIFVEVALRRNAIDPGLLRQALTSQAEMSRFGITRFVGAIVAEKQPALRDTVARIVEELAEFSIRCPKCREPAPVSDADRHGVIRCDTCESPILLEGERISEEELSTTLAGTRKKARKKHPREEPQSLPARSALPENRKPAAPPPRKAAPPAPPSPEPLPSSEVTKFRLEKLITGSPAGKLYRIQPSGELGALKVIDRALCADKVRLKKWIDYMQLAQDLPRSAMLKPAQLFREGSITYVVRPFLEVPARSARAEIERGFAQGEGHAVFASHLLGSLLSFHSANLVHGNLTPENVLITAEGACLTDPGLWILFEGLPGEERILRLCERSRYHAPEVLRGAEPTPASDIYSAGRILEEILAVSMKEQGSTGTDISRLVARMVAEDSVQRYPSAREALWDLRSGAALHQGGPPFSAESAPALPSEGRAGSGQARSDARPRKRARGSRAGAREKRLRFAGVAALAAVILLLSREGASWYSTRKAIASPGRSQEVSARLVEEEIAALQRTTESPSTASTDAVSAWKRMEELLRGTSWEERVREASSGPLAAAARRREGEGAARTAVAQARVDAKQYAEAIAILLREGGEPLAREAREVLVKAAEGLHAEEGMVCVPGADGPNGRARPFLIDAGIAPNTAGLSLAAVEELARSAGKRLLTGAEWDAAVRFARSGSPRELGPERISDLEGSLLQWVEDEAADDLARAGFGFCRGGTRPHAPATHAVRRKKSSSHSDVGARLGRDLPQVR
jgi:hypothetical protein